MKTRIQTAIMICLSLSLSAVAVVYAQDAKPKQKAKAGRESEEKAAHQDVILYKGLQTTLDIPFEPCMVGGSYDECIRIANKSLVTVQYSRDKKQLIFSPMAKGQTTINIRNDAGDIALILSLIVNDVDLGRRAVELKELLRDIEGIDIKIVNDKIVVDGEVIVLNDLNRLYAVLSDSSYKDIVLNLVTVSPLGLQLLAEKIQQEINNPGVRVRILNGIFVLEGQVDSVGQKEDAERIAGKMLAGYTLPTFALEGPRSPVEVRRASNPPIDNRLSIAPKKPEPVAKMVRLTVDFVELSKDYLRNFGFAWAPSLDANGGTISFGQSTTGGLTTQGNGSISGTIANLFPKLSTAQNAGYARVLEESVLIVKDGEKVSLARDLQIPIQKTTVVNGAVQTGFDYKDVGPTISMTPKIGQEENIDLNIDFTYVSLAGRTSDAPILVKHNYVSQAIIKNNESAALVNAISNSISTAFNKDPPGGLPTSPLFTLLRSKAFQKNKTQFVVFLTPQVIESTSQGTEDIKQRYGLKRKKQ